MEIFEIVSFRAVLSAMSEQYKEGPPSKKRKGQPRRSVKKKPESSARQIQSSDDTGSSQEQGMMEECEMTGPAGTVYGRFSIPDLSFFYYVCLFLISFLVFDTEGDATGLSSGGGMSSGSVASYSTAGSARSQNPMKKASFSAGKKAGNIQTRLRSGRGSNFSQKQEMMDAFEMAGSDGSVYGMFSMLDVDLILWRVSGSYCDIYFNLCGG